MHELKITEKRTSERHNLVRDVKVYHPAGDRYLSGQSLNVSDGGTLLAIRHGQHLEPGTTVQVAIDWTGQQLIHRQKHMANATVVRNEGTSGYACVVAMEYAHEQASRLAA